MSLHCDIKSRKIFFWDFLNELFKFLIAALTISSGFLKHQRSVKMDVTTNNTKSKVNIRLLVGTGMLSGLAFVLQYLEFPIPIMPGFIKFDFSDLPALIGAFA